MTKHSHEEYLNWLDKKLASKRALIIDLEKMLSLEPDSATTAEMLQEAKEDYASLLANRAVLVRHEETVIGTWPSKFSGRDRSEPDDIIRGCACCHISVPNPCPTYTDVTDSLDEVMG